MTPVQQYIARQPRAVQPFLRAMRRAIREAVPGTTEKISYRIPTFQVDSKTFVFFAAFPDHVSMYPVKQQDLRALGKAVARYHSGVGTLQFPVGRLPPVKLIAKVAKYRARTILGRHSSGAAQGRAARRMRR